MTGTGQSHKLAIGLLKKELANRKLELETRERSLREGNWGEELLELIRNKVVQDREDVQHLQGTIWYLESSH